MCGQTKREEREAVDETRSEGSRESGARGGGLAVESAVFDPSAAPVRAHLRHLPSVPEAAGSPWNRQAMREEEGEGRG